MVNTTMQSIYNKLVGLFVTQTRINSDYFNLKLKVFRKLTTEILRNFNYYFQEILVLHFTDSFWKLINTTFQHIYLYPG